jgi:hypothetical protein
VCACLPAPTVFEVAVDLAQQRAHSRIDCAQDLT